LVSGVEHPAWDVTGGSSIVPMDHHGVPSYLAGAPENRTSALTLSQAVEEVAVVVIPT
jgi:hypothetical protein